MNEGIACFVVPDDGQEHDCPACTHPHLKVWDCDGWAAPVVTDHEGRPVNECPACGIDLEPGTVESVTKQKRDEGSHG